MFVQSSIFTQLLCELGKANSLVMLRLIPFLFQLMKIITTLVICGRETKYFKHSGLK